MLPPVGLNPEQIDKILLRQRGSRKKLLNDALTANLDINGAFYRVCASGAYRVGQTDVIYDNVWNTDYPRRFLVLARLYS